MDQRDHDGPPSGLTVAFKINDTKPVGALLTGFLFGIALDAPPRRTDQCTSTIRHLPPPESLVIAGSDREFSRASCLIPLTNPSSS